MADIEKGPSIKELSDRYKAAQAQDFAEIQGLVEKTNYINHYFRCPLVEVQVKPTDWRGPVLVPRKEELTKMLAEVKRLFSIENILVLMRRLAKFDHRAIDEVAIGRNLCPLSDESLAGLLMGLREDLKLRFEAKASKTDKATEIVEPAPAEMPVAAAEPVQTAETASPPAAPEEKVEKKEKKKPRRKAKQARKEAKEEEEAA